MSKPSFTSQPSLNLVPIISKPNNIVMAANPTVVSFFRIGNKQYLLRYFQFSLLLIAIGVLYPLLYLRQNFEKTILLACNISSAELAELYAILGIVYVLSYVPSGWLADKFSPRFLLSFSLFGVGFLGLCFSSYPDFFCLKLIFIAWGLCAGLTFWASLLKAVKMSALPHEQGRFFGLLEGGRGLIEALLATIAMLIFASLSPIYSPQIALKPVIYLYSFSCLACAILIYIFLDHSQAQSDRAHNKATELEPSSLAQDIKFLLSMPELWLCSGIIFTGYQLFWATYSFSAYLQDIHSMPAITAGIIIVAKQWTRPLSGIGAGFLADKIPKENIITWGYLLISLCSLILINFPKSSPSYLLAMILLIGFLTYGVRGMYWALLDSCNIPHRLTGLAIGIISLIGYLPDIFLPILNSALASRFSPELSYKIYFSYIAGCGILGAIMSTYFHRLRLKLTPTRLKHLNQATNFT